MIAYEEMEITPRAGDEEGAVIEVEPSTSFIDAKPKPESMTAGLFCAAIGCKTNKFNDPNVQLFKFPAHKKR